jgi:glucan phosphoethanolaminetransferase (alkaline phosphatase superfamily)
MDFSTKFYFNKIFYFIVTSYLILSLLLTNKIWIVDQCLIVDTNFNTNLLKVVQNKITEKSEYNGLDYRIPMHLPKIKNSKKFNVLVLIFESLRSQNMSLYGYNKKTTPFLDSLFQQSNNLIFFKKAYTSSTTTMLAVPSILSGITSAQSKKLFHSSPLIWEYAKSLNYYTFFLSSQSMNWYNFDKFYANSNLNYYWNANISNLPYFNDFGIDENHLINQFENVIANNKDFFTGVIQFNTSHYPYTTPEQFQKWGEDFIDNYNNSILYQDFLIKRIFEVLKKYNLLENTIIIMAGDHGEAFREHGNIGHVDSFYLTTISIPLIFYIPEKQHSLKNLLSKNINKIVTNYDLVPTLLSIWDIENNKFIREIRKNFLGYNLLDKNMDSNRYVLSTNTNEFINFNVGFSIVNDSLHFIYRANLVPQVKELYNILKDPLEKNNLYSPSNEFLKDIKERILKIPEHKSYIKFLN